MDHGPLAPPPGVRARYVRGRHDEAAALAHPERLERRLRAIARLGGLLPPALVSAARSRETAYAGRMNRVLVDNDVLLTPVTPAPAPLIGRYEGRGWLWTLNGGRRHRPLRGSVEPDRPAGLLGARRASAPKGCQGRSSWWAAPTARPRCSRSQPSSRARGRGLRIALQRSRERSRHRARAGPPGRLSGLCSSSRRGRELAGASSWSASAMIVPRASGARALPPIW